MIGRLAFNLSPTFPALAGDRGIVLLTLYTDALMAAPLNLTGYASKFTLSDTAGAVLFSADEADGITLGGTAGTWSLNTGDMGSPPNVPAGEHTYLLELRNASGNLELLMLGAWIWDTDTSP